MKIRIGLLVLWLIITLAECRTGRNETVTVVTGLWNAGRETFKSGYARAFSYYLTYFKLLLELDVNMIIFGDKQLKQFVIENRKFNNTLFILKELEWFQHEWNYPKIQNIRNNACIRYNQSTCKYMKDFPNYGLPLYNPITMSKFKLLVEARQNDIFETDYYEWLDGGFVHKLNQAQLKAKTINTFPKIPFFINTPTLFQGGNFNIFKKGFTNQGRNYTDQIITQMADASFFFAHTNAVTTLTSVYQSFLRVLLEDGEMWTEQSVMTLMLTRYSYLIGFWKYAGYDRFNNLELFDKTPHNYRQKEDKIVLYNNYSQEIAGYHLFLNSNISAAELNNKFDQKLKKHQKFLSQRVRKSIFIFVERLIFFIISIGLLIIIIFIRKDKLFIQKKSMMLTQIEKIEKIEKNEQTIIQEN